ncbi:hypothetical protein [Chryseobacterium sp. H1D6B]|uniref:hypothetical protein n=1 Tax=Chryseobacterium sp. H1D6B TaxID=2940588 RepID=UPI002475A681|nr:hypothetical protein [Chryseobacterium sp. H1D6B]
MNITLKQKNLADGRISLFIEYYKGSSTNVQGKRIHLRDFEYLKLYLHPEPKTPKEKERIKKLWLSLKVFWQSKKLNMFKDATT